LEIWQTLKGGDMKAIQHFSSSSGNLYEIIAVNGKRLLIDPGVTWKKIQKALNYDLSNIVCAFALHSHLDHFKEPKKLMAAGIDIFASKETFESQGLLNDRRAKVVEDKTLVRLDSFQVLCFSVEHDCLGSLGIVVREIATGEYLLFAVDTAYIEQRFPYPFSIIMLECSYDGQILSQRVAAKTIDESLAKRLLTSHFEKSQAMRYISDFCDLSKCREINLLHLSAENIDKQQTINDFESKFFLRPITV